MTSYGVAIRSQDIVLVLRGDVVRKLVNELLGPAVIVVMTTSPLYRCPES